MVELATNADHQRSPLVDLTERGRTTYQVVDRKQAAWVSQLAAGLTRSDLDTAARVLGEELSPSEHFCQLIAPAGSSAWTPQDWFATCVTLRSSTGLASASAVALPTP